jgi:integrase
MGRRNTPGLQLRKGTWHIDKVIEGQRVCESTGTSDWEEAEAILATRITEARKAKYFGIRPKRSFREAATKYLLENETKVSIKTDAYHLIALDTYIGDISLDLIHDGTLAAFIAGTKVIKTVRKVGRQELITERPRKSKSINNALSVVRRILNLAARKWRDESGKTWLETAPLITFLDESDARKPYPISWAEQKSLISKLPGYLANMVLFKVNTGCREQEVCKLQWDWEVEVPELGTTIFVIPANFGGREASKGVKNGEDRVVVMNRVARSVIETQRGKHSMYVFPVEDGKPMHRMNTSAWNNATKKAADALADETGKPAAWSFQNLRVHDLKHTFGRRLRAAGVPLETRKVLLGHTTGDITTHYSAAELGELVEAVEKVCDNGNSLPTLTLIKAAEMASHAKVTHKGKMG